MGDAAEKPLRIKIVRAGVTVLEQSMEREDDRFKAFSGCILLFHDEELETDLTGFQIIQNDAFLEKIDSFQPLLLKARSYFDKGKTMIQGHPLS